MDDLASEGLLLIRMEPDDRGRYGFIVKVRNCRSELVTLTTLYRVHVMSKRLTTPYHVHVPYRGDLMKEWPSLLQRSHHNLQ